MAIGDPPHGMLRHVLDVWTLARPAPLQEAIAITLGKAVGAGAVPAEGGGRYCVETT